MRTFRCDRGIDDGQIQELFTRETSARQRFVGYCRFHLKHSELTGVGIDVHQELQNPRPWSSPQSASLDSHSRRKGVSENHNSPISHGRRVSKFHKITKSTHRTPHRSISRQAASQKQENARRSLPVIHGTEYCIGQTALRNEWSSANTRKYQAALPDISRKLSIYLFLDLKELSGPRLTLYYRPRYVSLSYPKPKSFRSTCTPQDPDTNFSPKLIRASRQVLPIHMPYIV